MDRAYKRLSKSDVIVTPFTANKQWTIPSASYSSSNILIYEGKNLDDGATTTDNQEKYLIYKSVEQLYYRNYVSASLDNTSSFFTQNGNLATQSLQSGSYWNYPQSTVGEIRYFPTGSGVQIHVMGIPREIYGSQIKPGTLTFTNPTYGTITDDKQGNLIYNSGSLYVNKHIGNIIYPHGILIFTDLYGSILKYFIDDGGTPVNNTASFQNEHIIYENTVKCTVRESEFNYTHNPSISTDTSGSLRDFATGSIFTPYVTTVGLYNDSQELLAVAKMSQPTPLSTNTDTTFLINYDT